MTSDWILTLVAAKCLVCYWWKALKVNWVTSLLSQSKIADQNLHLAHCHPYSTCWQRQLSIKAADMMAVNAEFKALQANAEYLELCEQLAQQKAQAEQEGEAQRLLIIEGRKTRKEQREQGKKTLDDKPSNGPHKWRVKQGQCCRQNQQKYLKLNWDDSNDFVKVDHAMIISWSIKSKEHTASHQLQHKLYCNTLSKMRKSSEDLNPDLWRHAKQDTTSRFWRVRTFKTSAIRVFKQFTHHWHWLNFGGVVHRNQSVSKILPSCQSKCVPILGHMMSLEVDPNPNCWAMKVGIDILFRRSSLWYTSQQVSLRTG